MIISILGVSVNADPNKTLSQLFDEWVIPYRFKTRDKRSYTQLFECFEQEYKQIVTDWQDRQKTALDATASERELAKRQLAKKEAAETIHVPKKMGRPKKPKEELIKDRNLNLTFGWWMNIRCYMELHKATARELILNAIEYYEAHR